MSSRKRKYSDGISCRKSLFVIECKKTPNTEFFVYVCLQSCKHFNTKDIIKNVSQNKLNTLQGAVTVLEDIFSNTTIMSKLPAYQRVCKFYVQFFGDCTRRQTCRFMHEDFPCKMYHMRELICPFGNRCLFSHAKLNNIQRTVLTRFSDMSGIERDSIHRYYMSNMNKNEVCDSDVQLLFDTPISVTPKFKNTRRIYNDDDDDDDYDYNENEFTDDDRQLNKKSKALGCNNSKKQFYNRDREADESLADVFDIEPAASPSDNRDCLNDVYKYSLSPDRRSRCESRMYDESPSPKRRMRSRSPRNSETRFSPYRKNYSNFRGSKQNRFYPHYDKYNSYSNSLSKYRGRARIESATKDKKLPLKDVSSETFSQSMNKIRCVADVQDEKSLYTNTDSQSSNAIKKSVLDPDIFVNHNEFQKIEERLKKNMQLYLETPEIHPAYKEEWNKFWSSRFKELSVEGKHDPNLYNYKPEWIKFWDKRVKELHQEDLTRYKEKFKKKTFQETGSVTEPKIETTCKIAVDTKLLCQTLNDTEENEKLPKSSSVSLLKKDNADASSLVPKMNTAGSVPKQSTESSVLELNSVISEAQAKSLLTEPGCVSDFDSTHGSRSPERDSNSQSRSRSRSCSKEKSKPSHSIIAILRQLSVLEPQLGSYANHVISLLSCGLTMEKIKPQSSADLLTKENVMFLELVQEKLKGQLLAGIVQQSMTKPTLFCVKNIEELLSSMPDQTPTVAPPIPVPPSALLSGVGGGSSRKTSQTSQQEKSCSSFTVTNISENVGMEFLPDNELIKLLRNFKNIPRTKQTKLIEYLKRLEDKDPNRVEDLKKYVNVS